MDKSLTPPISIEQFAAYIDSNLPESEMREIDFLIDSNAIMEELADISDIIDEDINMYLLDEFAYDADMTVLYEQDFEIPEIGAGPAGSISDEYDNYDDNSETDITTEKENEYPLHEFEEKQLHDSFTVENDDFCNVSFKEIDDTDQYDAPTA